MTSLSAPAPHGPMPGRDTRPPLRRLVRVELRKMTNTRAGAWLPVGIALATLLTACLSAAHHGGTGATRVHVLGDALYPSIYLLPVMGVLLLAGEWTQRTTLTTFTLVPSRSRVLLAKLGACLTVATVALLGCVLAAVCTVALFGHAPGGPGSLSPGVLLQDWAVVLVEMIVGVAFAAAILLTPAAIVGLLLLPLITNTVTQAFSGLAEVARWLSPYQVINELTTATVPAAGWAHLLVLSLVWVGIPLLVGARRIIGGDIA